MQPALITTVRLALRPLTQADAVDFHALVTRPEVARMLFMFYPEWPLEAARQFISEWAWRGSLRFRLAITAENQWIGWIGVSDDPIPEIFYALTAEAAGKGYAAEAVAGFCAFLFDRFNMPTLAAGVFTDNPASARVLEKCGFALESQAMHASKGRDGLSPCFTFHLPRPDLPPPTAVPLFSHLQTARLRLRPVLASDEAGVVAALNDLAISGWLARVPLPYTKADFHEFLAEVAYPGEIFAIEDAQGFVGIIGAGFELGYWLIPRAHGLGYATEAATAVLAMQFAHDESTVAAGYFEGNHTSARVLAKLGFVEIGRRPKLCRADGIEKPHVDLMLTREQFLAATAIEILTPRLRLAPLDVERDWRDIARIGGDPRVAPMTSSHRSPWPEAEVRAFLVQSQWQGRPSFRLGIWFEGKLIGAVGIWDDPAETGYFLDPAFWGRGFATEAMAAFLPQMMARFGMCEVMADHCADNPASGAVLRKLGFQRVGEGMGDSLERGPVPITLYRLLGPKVKNS